MKKKKNRWQKKIRSGVENKTKKKASHGVVPATSIALRKILAFPELFVEGFESGIDSSFVLWIGTATDETADAEFVKDSSCSMAALPLDETSCKNFHSLGM